MRQISILFFFCFSIFNSSCEENEEKLTPEVSLYIDGKHFTSHSALNVYSLEKSLTGLNRIGIHIRVNPYSENEIDISLDCVSGGFNGSYTNANSIENDFLNALSISDKTDIIYGKSSSRCQSAGFSFTIEQQLDDPTLLSGTFQGTACDDNGNAVTVSRGTFKNFRLFPSVGNE